MATIVDTPSTLSINSGNTSTTSKRGPKTTKTKTTKKTTKKTPSKISRVSKAKTGVTKSKSATSANAGTSEKKRKRTPNVKKGVRTPKLPRQRKPKIMNDALSFLVKQKLKRYACARGLNRIANATYPLINTLITDFLNKLMDIAKLLKSLQNVKNVKGHHWLKALVLLSENGLKAHLLPKVPNYIDVGKNIINTQLTTPPVSVGSKRKRSNNEDVVNNKKTKRVKVTNAKKGKNKVTKPTTKATKARVPKKNTAAAKKKTVTTKRRKTATKATASNTTNTVTSQTINEDNQTQVSDTQTDQGAELLKQVMDNGGGTEDDDFDEYDNNAGGGDDDGDDDVLSRVLAQAIEEDE